MKCCNYLLAVNMVAVACRDCGVCVWLEKWKDVGMAIYKSIVVSFLPCLVVFLGFHPYIFFHFLQMFFGDFVLLE